MRKPNTTSALLPLPDARQLVNVWRDRTDPRWKAAHDELRRQFFMVARRKPTIRRLPIEQREDELDGLFSAFWIHLTESPRALDANRIMGLGAIRAHMARFLNDFRDDSEDGSVPDRMRRHLKENKIVPALRRDARFEQVVRRGPWLLANWAESPPKCESVPDDCVLLDILPELAADLDPQNRAQLPPLVAVEALPPFLALALELSQRPRSEWDLTYIAWNRLRPSPDSVFAFARVADEPNHSAWDRRVDLLASKLADSLSERQRQLIVLLDHGMPTSEVMTLLEIGRSSFYSEKDKARITVEGLVIEECLDEVQAALLRKMLVSLLEPEVSIPTRSVR